MGFPRKVEVKGLLHTAGATATAVAAPDSAPAADGTAATEATTGGAAETQPRATRGGVAEGGGGPGSRRRRPGREAGGRAKAGALVETLVSKCPLKWACSELYPVQSSYTSAFGAKPPGATQVGGTGRGCGGGCLRGVEHCPAAASCTLGGVYLEPKVARNVSCAEQCR
jgi:hypothetical protein